MFGVGRHKDGNPADFLIYPPVGDDFRRGIRPATRGRGARNPGLWGLICRCSGIGIWEAFEKHDSMVVIITSTGVEM